MSLRIRWEPQDVPEERHKPSWEGIIRTTVGEPSGTLDVRIHLPRGRHRWRLDARLQSEDRAEPPSAASAVYAARIVAALRAAGKPVD
jgi:hypothetical protein